jgi:hypothetical protein
MPGTVASVNTMLYITHHEDVAVPESPLYAVRNTHSKHYLSTIQIVRLQPLHSPSPGPILCTGYR